MCGITGLLHKSDKPIDLAILQNMTRLLTHRGPDDEGYFIKGQAGLGHRRLSIIDLSSGHQPMTTPDGRYTIVFNGEIYNFLELRKDLEKKGIALKTNSDTEVLLHLYALSGADCLHQLNGMFAFAIWDDQEKKIFGARDRMGKKPFYYWNTPHLFALASECKALRAHPDFRAEINFEALSHYFQYECLPAPYSIYKDVSKLPAGHFLIADQNEIKIQCYWDVPFQDKKLSISEEDAQKEILGLLDRAVDLRLISDVPLGVFLSGGIDSSAVVGLMARHREGKDIQTFSIGFKEKSYDETPYSALVAKKFGTDHHHQVLSAKKMLDILPEVTGFLDEPFSDYSIVPTYLLSTFTRQTVTVALGGDGGDELFAGYPTFYAERLARIYQKIPKPLRALTLALGNALPVSHNDMSFDFKVKQFLYGAPFPAPLRSQVWLGALHQEEQKQLFLNPSDALSVDPLKRVSDQVKQCGSSFWGDQMLYFYQKFYLCDDILVKADRASMATSLEVRAPFLDVNVVEYVTNLPYHLKIKGSQTKYILKKTLEAILPNEILYRKKKGFGIPIAQWLREDLKDKMLATLNRKKMEQEGIFNPHFVDQLVSEHLSGKKNNRKQLFALLMFEWWRERYL